MVPAVPVPEPVVDDPGPHPHQRAQVIGKIFLVGTGHASTAAGPASDGGQQAECRSSDAPCTFHDKNRGRLRSAMIPSCRGTTLRSTSRTPYRYADPTSVRLAARTAIESQRRRNPSSPTLNKVAVRIATYPPNTRASPRVDMARPASGLALRPPPASPLQRLEKRDPDTLRRCLPACHLHHVAALRRPRADSQPQCEQAL